MSKLIPAKLFWLLLIVVCLGFGIWLLGFWVGGCSSMQNAEINITTTTSTSASTSTTVPQALSGISGEISWDWAGASKADRWGKLLVAVFPNENFDKGQELAYKMYDISGESSRIFSFDTINSGTYYILGLLYVKQSAQPFDDPAAGSKIGQYSDGNVPISGGGSTHALPINYTGGDLPGINFSLNGIVTGGKTTTTNNNPTTTTTLPVAAGWDYVGKNSFCYGNNSSLFVTNEGGVPVPYVAALQQPASNQIIVMKYNNGANTWEALGTPGSSCVPPASPVINVFKGTPYVAYLDASRKVSVKKYTGGNWVNVGGGAFSSGSADFVSFDIYDNGGDGVPYVAYSDMANGFAANVMRFDGAKWVNVGDPGFSSGEARSLNLNLCNNIPHVSFMDAAPVSGRGMTVYVNKASLMKYESGNWSFVGDRYFSGGEIYYLTNSLYKDGTPYVTYQDYSNSLKASVMKYSTGSWGYLGGSGFSDGAAIFPSLKIYDDKGAPVPYLAFGDQAYFSSISVMKYSGGNWRYLGAPGFSGTVARDTSLFVYDDGGQALPFVVFTNPGDNTISVMKFTGQ